MMRLHRPPARPIRRLPLPAAALAAIFLWFLFGITGCAGSSPSEASDDETTPGEPTADETAAESSEDDADSGDNDGPSLLDDADRGAVFNVGEVSISYDALAGIGAGTSVPETYGVMLSPVLEAGLDGDLTRYQNQVQYVVNEVHSGAIPRRVHLLGATYRDFDDLDGGRSIVATVLIDNRTDDTITEIVVDAELSDSTDTTVAEGRFLLRRPEYGELASQTMLLANLIFPPARVRVDDADLVNAPELDSTVDWEVVEG